MATQNPFHLWLGLSADLDNPNYYQLLGVEPTERDVAKIEHAAKEKLKLLKQVDAKKHAAVLEKIKKRVRLAYSVIANDKKRQEYDQLLIAKLTAAASQPARPAEIETVDDTTAPPVPPPILQNATSDIGETEVPMALPIAPPKDGIQPAAKPELAAPEDDVPELAALGGSGVAVAIKKRKDIKRKRSPVALIFCALLGIASVSGLVYLTMNWDWIVAYTPDVEEEKPPITEAPDDGNTKKTNEGDPKTVEDKSTTTGVDDVKPEKKIIKRPTKLEDIKPPEMDEPKKRVPKDETTNTKPAKIETDELDFDNQVYYRRTMQSVQRALYRRNKTVAENQLSNAASLFLMFADNPNLEIVEQQADWERLVDSTMQVKDYLAGFWEQVITSSVGISGGQEIEASGKIVGFVESTSRYVILRVGGQNVTYRYENIPPGLAVALAEQGAKEDVPTWRMQKAAFYAVHKDLDPDYGRKAKVFADQAADDGHDPKPIYDFVDIDLNTIGVPEDKTDLPEPDVVMTALNEMEIDVGVNVRRQMRPEQAVSAVDTLMDSSITAGDEEERVIRLHAAYLAAKKTNDAFLLKDTIQEIEYWMNCEPVERLSEGLQQMGRQQDEMSESQKRSFVETVVSFFDESNDNRVKRKLKTLAEKICKENDFDDLLRQLD